MANTVGGTISVINAATRNIVATILAGTEPYGLALTPNGTKLYVAKRQSGLLHGGGRHLPTLGPIIPAGRVSSEGWSGCVSRHANGLTDSVVWIFGTGPRRSLPLNATFNPHNPNDQKILNYSAVNDELQDFESNIRGTQGGAGLIDGALNAGLAAQNGGRSVALDALKEFVARGIRTPISPLRNVNPFSQDARDLALGHHD